ncbi:MAG: hypothetical protein MN733_10705 [Nitrososphaera sp.]|nr:hypothetical protein [Nitrososphaera sp.]
MIRETDSTIHVPASFADRIAALGRLLLSLANDLEAYRADTSPITKPKNVPKDQEWYWSKKWQKWERQADEDIVAGRVKEFSSIEELVADLNT